MSATTKDVGKAAGSGLGRVLVTGGAGLIGSHIVDLLVAERARGACLTGTCPPASASV